MKPAHLGRWPMAALLLWLACTGPLSLTRAGAQSRDERAVRAAYVYNLIRYVEWPAQEKDLTVALVGDAATNAVIGPLLNGRNSEGHSLHVVQPASGEELERCSVIYVSGASDGDIRKIVEKLKGRSVLTVGESEAFTRAGGMVALVNTGDHIRVEVNLDAAQAGGIRISSRVLGLATIVHSARKEGN